MFFILSVQRKDISTNLTASLHYRILQVRKIKLITYRCISLLNNNYKEAVELYKGIMRKIAIL